MAWSGVERWKLELAEPPLEREDEEERGGRKKGGERKEGVRGNKVHDVQAYMLKTR